MKVKVNLDVLQPRHIIFLLEAGAVDDEGLDELAHDKRCEIRRSVAKNATRDSLLWILAGDKKPEVRYEVLMNPNASHATTSKALATDEKQGIRR